MKSLFLCLFAPVAFAGSSHETPQPTTSTQTQTQGQSLVSSPVATSAATASASPTVSNEAALTVENKYQAPSTFTTSPTPTAPCYYVNSWGLGVPAFGFGRGKSRKDDDCWAEYVRHQQAMESIEQSKAQAELERVKLERDRVALEVRKLDICHAECVKK